MTNRSLMTTRTFSSAFCWNYWRSPVTRDESVILAKYQFQCSYSHTSLQYALFLLRATSRFWMLCLHQVSTRLFTLDSAIPYSGRVSCECYHSHNLSHLAAGITCVPLNLVSVECPTSYPDCLRRTTEVSSPCRVATRRFMPSAPYSETRSESPMVIPQSENWFHTHRKQLPASQAIFG